LPRQTLGEELKLPDLHNFHYGPLEPIEQPDSAAVSAVGEQELAHSTSTDEEYDIWNLALSIDHTSSAPKYYSWEAFQSGEQVVPLPAYISERDDSVFNAAIHVQAESNGSAGSVPVQSDVFLDSLFALGLGRSSVLFNFDGKKKTFIAKIQNMRMSGYSVEASESLISKILQCGTMTRRLRSYVDRTYTINAFSGRIAFANSISAILSTMERQLSYAGPAIKSLLQLQHNFEQPHRLLVEIYDLVKALRKAKSNEELVSTMYRRCQYYEQEPPWLQTPMFEILSRVSQPWLETVEQWTGLKQDRGSQFTTKIATDQFVTATKADGENESRPTEEYCYHPERMPSFILPEDGRIIFETGCSLRILRKHHPRHPLSRSHAFGSNDMSLSWQFDWTRLDSIVDKANEYHQRLVEAVRAYGTHSQFTLQEHTSTAIPAVHNSNLSDGASCWNDEVLTLAHQMDSIPSLSPDSSNKFYDPDSSSVQSSDSVAASDSINFSPPLSLAAALSFQPLLSTQARLINAATLRVLFRSHNLRLHFDLQRSFHLFGNGVFISRLSSALFDPDVPTTERQRGVVRSHEELGLKIGKREAWPPASSELRLALMGILSDCYHAEHRMSKNSSREPIDLPDSLSFSIRQLSESEIEKVMDPRSLHALDFLRLQYTPPSPLDAVITTKTLEKYDTIFKFLLRIMRMLYVALRLPYIPGVVHAQKLKHQAQHFVSSCAAYFFDTGIRESWDAFSFYVDSIEKKLHEEDQRGELGTLVTDGLETLKMQHELCLNRIMFALLLRNRQQKIMALVEDIFTHILQFARISVDDESRLLQISKIYHNFNEKVKLFLDVCKGLVGKKAYAGSSGNLMSDGRKNIKGEENTIDRLLLKLEMSKYYNGN